MIRIPLRSLIVSSLSLSSALACSAASPSESQSPDGAGAATGGAATDDGGGGAPPTGGAPAGSGGANDGAEPPPLFSCPAGSAGQTPTLSGKTPTLVATAPEMEVSGGEQVFLEGPIWADGSLYVSQLRKWGDQPPASILRLVGGSLEPFIAESGSNGIALTREGRLLTANHAAFGLVEFELVEGARGSTLVDSYEGQPFNSPNDLTIATDGSIYFTDPSYQCGNNCPQGSQNNRVYRVSPQGAVSVLPSEHAQPNGIALSPDEGTLYVAGDGPMERFSLLEDGSVTGPSPFAEVQGVDGLAIDCAGNVYATVHGPGRVDVFTPAGALLGSLEVGAPVTNAAFGGAEHQTLYVTRYDAELVSFELDIPGFPY